jgi:hypothetical protein
MPNPETIALEPDSLSDRIVSKTPWWFVSVFLHAIAFIVAALVIVIARPPGDLEVVSVNPAPWRPLMEPDITPPKDLQPSRADVPVQNSDSDPIFKRPEEAERAETDNDSDLRTERGESLDAPADRPFKGPSLSDVAGIQGGAAGLRGLRDIGGRLNRARTVGGNDRTEAAVQRALDWLARHQSADGSWNMKRHLDRCGAVPGYAGACAPHGVHDAIDASAHNHDVGLTGLALLAFLGSGHTHLSAERRDGIVVGDVVRNAIQYLIRVQDRDGCIGSRDVREHMYDHAIAALALSEAYGLTGSNKFRDAAQRAIDFLIAAQNPGKGWRYDFQSGENDTSVTGWAVMALKSADLSGLPFDKAAAYDGARAFLDAVTFKTAAPGTGVSTRWEAGYQGPIKEIVAIPGVNDQYADHPAMTAVAVMCRIFMDRQRNDPRVAGGARAVADDPPRRDGNAIDYYYWYYGSLALYQYDAPNGALWRAWNEKMTGALLASQNAADGQDRKGSWEPVDRWSCVGGRVYATAINALTLEVYYRYATVFGGAPK